MLRSITISADLFNGESDRNRSQRSLLWLMEALVSINREYLRSFPRTPRLYEAGVRYVGEEDGAEDWQAVPAVIRNAGGDCEDLACWRVAEQLEAGVSCRPFIRWRRYGDGFYLYHVLVEYPGGRMEDPSRVLGMGKD